MILKSEMLTLELHPSLARGLFQSADLAMTGSLAGVHADRLISWAATCENPVGQKADLARAVAALVRVTDGLKIENEQPARGFWETVGA
jgi:hypothetical protein